MDDLETPLKAQKNAGARRRLPVSLLGLLTLALATTLGIAIGWVMLFDDPLGGEPKHVVKIEQIIVPPSQQTKTAPDANNPPAKQMPPQQTGDQRTITIIDGNTGTKREIVINGAKADDKNTPANEPTNNVPPADSRLIEPSKHGSLPKIGPDGVRPLDAYASPIPVATSGADSMIAIVITGLGVSESSTNDAISKLPAAVTLGFVPYGNELQRWVARARSTGHEVLLQIPMEPFDYPDNDPGPQTLTASAPKDQNIDRLHYFLSRTQGYVGVANFMGARFTANEEALATVFGETGKRGLLFLDDGTSPRSVAPKAAARTKAPFLKADVVIDSKAEWAEIDAALVKLEAIAAEKGIAIATASSLPVTIERLARWAKTLETRGIRLVPVSAAFHRKAKQS
ncbi:MAG: divergent polysaccharide deacetylase family protein [Xanthobacteraceae bacterium]|nr:divergent polysaccharide deacetylase family protein [Xanthobacteraceae bacterium]